jgi:hypothetical protein
MKTSTGGQKIRHKESLYYSTYALSGGQGTFTVTAMLSAMLSAMSAMFALPTSEIHL